MYCLLENPLLGLHNSDQVFLVVVQLYQNALCCWHNYWHLLPNCNPNDKHAGHIPKQDVLIFFTQKAAADWLAVCASSWIFSATLVWIVSSIVPSSCAATLAVMVSHGMDWETSTKWRSCALLFLCRHHDRPSGQTHIMRSQVGWWLDVTMTVSLAEIAPWLHSTRTSCQSQLSH